MSAPKFGLSDHSLRRVAEAFASRSAIEHHATQPEEEHAIRFASYEAAKVELKNRGFEEVGSAMFKQGHALWQLSKSSGAYSLLRVASEPDVFEEDAVHEAPGMHSEEHLKMGSRDRFGVQVRAGDVVHYSLGGEPVKGRVVRASYGYLDIQLPNQMDSGVPSDMVLVDRLSRQASAGEDPSLGIVRDSPMHAADSADKDNMNMKINPEKAAAFAEHHFASYGATLADLLEQPLSKSVVAKINLLAQEAKACEKCKGAGCPECMCREASKVESWSSIRRMVQGSAVADVCSNVKAGLQARNLSKSAAIPFAVAYELRDDLAHIPVADTRAIFATAKNIRTASAEDKAFQALASHLGPEFASHLASHVLAFQHKALALQKVAVDQTAEDYWKAYYGDYGDQWVRAIKRRIKADLVKAALVKQAVDETAAEYWANYYGDYGDKLVDEVDRATSTKKDVTARRAPMNADAPPMTLPQPVARRDIFANANILADERWEGNRVALAKCASGAFQVLIRSGNAQKAETAQSFNDAVSKFRQAVYAHCGI